MTKYELAAAVAERTGIQREYVLVVIDETIGLIKRTVEGGEAVTLNEFMTVYLRHKEDFTASQFVGKRGRHGRPIDIERRVFKGGNVPWVKVSKKWKREVLNRPAPPPKREADDKNQLKLFEG
jgi:nucleoid DNA-binding protein